MRPKRKGKTPLGTLDAPDHDSGAKTYLPALKLGTTDVMKTLTLIVGKCTGWALLQGDQIVRSGSVQLAEDLELVGQRQQGRDRTADIRFTRLMNL